MKSIPKDSYWQIRASGKASETAVNDALKSRISDLGNPTLMVLVREKIDNAEIPPSGTGTERALVKVFSDFEFVDKQQIAAILARDNSLASNAYGDPQKALLAAAELDANYLIVGQTEVNIGKQIEGTSMHSVQATVGYKVIDVNTGHILAADTSTAAQPHVNNQQGAQLAIKKAVDESFPAIKQQMIVRWQSGNVIRLTVEGPGYDQLIDSGFLDQIRQISGVNEVNDRGQTGNSVLIEIKALMSGTKLYGKMRERFRETKFKIEQKEIKNSRMRISITFAPRT